MTPLEIDEKLKLVTGIHIREKAFDLVPPPPKWEHMSIGKLYTDEDFETRLEQLVNSFYKDLSHCTGVMAAGFPMSSCCYSRSVCVKGLSARLVLYYETRVESMIMCLDTWVTTEPFT